MNNWNVDDAKVAAKAALEDGDSSDHYDALRDLLDALDQQAFEQEVAKIPQEVFEKLDAEFAEDPKDGIVVYTDDWRTVVQYLKGMPRENIGTIGYVEQAARAQGGQVAEPVAFVCETSAGKYYGDSQDAAIDECRAFAGDVGPEPAKIMPLYSRPQPAQQGSVPEGWKDAAVGAKRFAEDPKMVLAQPLTAGAHIRGMADLILSAPTTPQPEGDGWKPAHGMSDELPEIGKPVMGYHPDWVDDDFCADGIRECFLFGDGSEWQSARWDGYADQWIVEDGAPKSWQHHPQPPAQEKE